MKICQKCNHTYRANSCSQCKTNERALLLGGAVEPCSRCGIHAPLLANQECRRCLAKRGLKECDTCHKIKRYNLDFYGHRSSCKACCRSSEFNPGLSKYGLDQQTYDALVASQNGQCAICGSEAPLAIDHDHITNKVRGLLCRNCNIGIGHFRDSERHLERAIAYLKKTGTEDRHSPRRLETGKYFVELWEAHTQEIEKFRETLRRHAETIYGVTAWLGSMRAFFRAPGPENPEIRKQIADGIQERIERLHEVYENRC